MKVKIGDQIFDSNIQPIMVVMEESEKTSISNMSKDNYKFCSYPENMSESKIKEFMKVDEEAVSKAQQALFGIALGVKRGDTKLDDIPEEHKDKVKGIIDSMSEEEIEKMASTKTEDLPNKVEEAKSKNRMPSLSDVYESYRPLGKTSMDFYVKGIVQQHIYKWAAEMGIQDPTETKTMRTAGKLWKNPRLSLPRNISKSQIDELVKDLEEWYHSDHKFDITKIDDYSYMIYPTEKINEEGEGVATLDSIPGRGDISLGNDTSDSNDNTKGSGEVFGKTKKKRPKEEEENK